MSDKCPTCGRDDFPSAMAMRVHHAKSHGESIAKTKTCEYCNSQYRDPKGNKDQYCTPQCYRDDIRENPEKHPRWEEFPTAECEICGDEFKYRPSSQKGRFCSNDCRGEWWGSQIEGEENPAWAGGHPRYYGKDWKETRKRVLERDGACVRCGANEDLEVHHRKPLKDFNQPEDANSLDNLKTLCKSCHIEVENRRRDIRKELEDGFSNVIA